MLDEAVPYDWVNLIESRRGLRDCLSASPVVGSVVAPAHELLFEAEMRSSVRMPINIPAFSRSTKQPLSAAVVQKDDC